MKTLILTILMLCVCISAQAYVDPTYRDFKPATQQMIEKQTITNAAPMGSADVLSAHAGNTSALAASATTFVAQPDVARNLIITAGGVTANLNACLVTVTGTDYLNKTFSEVFPMQAASAVPVVGKLAFKTVTSVSFPANCEATPFGVTWSIGYGDKIGVKRCMTSAGHVLFATAAGVYESTRPVVTVGATIRGNVVKFNTALDSTTDFELFFIQNFSCLP
jgi:hypothetical protein